MSWNIAIMGELSRRGVKAFAVLSFMAFTSCAIAGRGAFHLFTPPPAICRCSSVGKSVSQIMEMSLVRVQPSAPRPKADSVQGLKAGKPLPAGCVQICPVSRAWLREGPFDLPALNRALLRTRRRLRDESVNAGYRGECSKAGEAVSKTAWVGLIPNRPCQL